MERRLAAILAADVVGYSRLMEDDEEATAERLRASRAVIDALIAEHSGRIFASAGDSVVAEFASPVEAVRCAVEIQRGLAAQNATLPANQRMLLRIGVNLGDVMVQGRDLLGDGVNVAARLETLAEPGGVYISGTVHDQIRDKLGYGIEDLGEVAVKNIARPVPTFRVLTEPGVNAPTRGRRRTRRGAALAAGLGLVLVLAAAGTFAWYQLGPGRMAPPAVETGSEALSIAVLPFDNMSGDPEQEYFSDGLTEDLITSLSRISGLFVIARNSVFTYKGTPVLVQEVGRDLGVSYVLEGSVRKAGTRLRINAQLVDAATGRHLWAERFDRELTDVFVLQDDVVGKIVSALAVELTPDEAQRLDQAAKADPEIYDLMLRGRERFVRFTKEGNEEARALYEKVIAMDPGNARAHANLAFTHAQDVIRGWIDTPQRALDRALDASRVALALDETLPQVHFVLANIRMAQKQPAAAFTAAQRAVELDPNYADGYAAMAQALNWAGRPQEALKWIERASRLNPYHPFMYAYIRGHTDFVAERFDDAATSMESVLERNPDFVHGHIFLAASYGHLGRREDAAWEIEELLLLHPEFSLQRARQSALYEDEADVTRFLDGLRKAGLPE